MRRLRRHRRWLLPWLAAVLLWAQWLTAAYACPQLRPLAEGGVGASWVAIEAAMPDCAGHGPAAMDPEQPQLCKAHCQSGQQSVNSQPGVLDAPSAPMPGAAWVGWVVLAEPPSMRANGAGARTPGPSRGSPPLYLSLLALRC